MAKKTLILLCCFVACITAAQNFALRWHSESLEGAPTNCIAEWRDNRGSTATPARFDFVTNVSGLRFYLAFSETNFNAWNSNRTFTVSSNRMFWIGQRDSAISNVMWYSTNVSVLNMTLAMSNVFVLRAAEERLK